MNTLKRILKAFLCISLALAVVLPALPAVYAENPTIQTSFTPDPAPMVYNDTFYFYTGHDADNASNYIMTDWQCFSSTDMKNWTNHGSVLSYTDFEWAEPDSCWAAQCVERNGKFYFYVTLSSKEAGGARAIGVAVGDTPTGPFKDAIGKPLCGPDWAYIDPTVLIDDDGQAYLYFGNPTLHYVKLKDNMIELDGAITACDMNSKQFGSNDQMSSLYTEGPWIYKRNGLYYMVYAASGIPETIDYSVSDSPTGPWEYKGRIMEPYTSFTLHPGIAEYKGHAYYTYHSADISNGNGFCRSGAIEEFEFKSNGDIPLIKPTREGPAQIQHFNPYLENQAETFCTEEGIKVAQTDNGIYLTKCGKGDYIRVAGVNFAEKATGFTANASAVRTSGKIELRLDAPDGKLIGTVNVAEGEEDEAWQTLSCEISGASGVHDLYFCFDVDVNRGYVNFDSWKFDGVYNEDDFEKAPEPIKPKSKNMTALIAVSVIVVICVIIAAVLAVTKGKKKDNKKAE